MLLPWQSHETACDSSRESEILDSFDIYELCNTEKVARKTLWPPLWLVQHLLSSPSEIINLNCKQLFTPCHTLPRQTTSNNDLAERTENASPKQDLAHLCSLWATDEISWGCWAGSSLQLDPIPTWTCILCFSSKTVSQDCLLNNKF